LTEDEGVPGDKSKAQVSMRRMSFGIRGRKYHRGKLSYSEIVSRLSGEMISDIAC
jgi:hypothetical protein